MTTGRLEDQAHPEEQRHHEVGIAADGDQRLRNVATEAQQEPHRRREEHAVLLRAPLNKSGPVTTEEGKLTLIRRRATMRLVSIGRRQR